VPVLPRGGTSTLVKRPVAANAVTASKFGFEAIELGKAPLGYSRGYFTSRDVISDDLSVWNFLVVESRVGAIQAPSPSSIHESVCKSCNEVAYRFEALILKVKIFRKG